MMKVDHYLDLQCVQCGRNRSTDFELGLFQGLPSQLVKLSRREGWTMDPETSRPICPICSKQKGR